MSLTAAEEAQTRELLAQQAAILSLADSEATILSKLGATKVNISQLPAATSLADADLMLVRQGTTDKSGTFATIKSWFNTATTANDPTFADNSTRPASTGWVRNAMSAIAASAGFSISIGTNWYIKLPSFLGGLIIQGGTYNAASWTNATITFPIAFPNNVVCRLVSINSNSTPSGVSATPISNSQMQIYVNASAAAHTVAWIVVGN